MLCGISALIGSGAIDHVEEHGAARLDAGFWRDDAYPVTKCTPAGGGWF